MLYLNLYIIHIQNTWFSNGIFRNELKPSSYSVYEPVKYQILPVYALKQYCNKSSIRITIV